jgi:hypothetical protein
MRVILYFRANTGKDMLMEKSLCAYRTICINNISISLSPSSLEIYTSNVNDDTLP